MRVLLVSQRFPPDGVGGVERYTQTLAAELVRQGATVSVLTRRNDNAQGVRTLRERLPDGTLIYRMIAGNFKFDRFFDKHDTLEALFTNAMLEMAPDIVHLNHVMGLSPRYIPIAHGLGAAVVVSLHDFYFACPLVHLQRPTGELCNGPDQGRECARTCFATGAEDGPLRWGLRASYFQAALSMADAIVSYSEHVASYFRRLMIDKDSLYVTSNGVPPELPAMKAVLSRPTEQGKTLRLAYCGTVAMHK